MAGRLQTIIGPMFSGKCIAGDTLVFAQTLLDDSDICSPMLIRARDVTPTTWLYDEYWQPVRVGVVTAMVATREDPLWEIEYDVEGRARATICATEKHIVPIEMSCDGDILREMCVRDLLALYTTRVIRGPIVGEKYYGIVLCSGYYFMIHSREALPCGVFDTARAVPTHNSSLLVCAIERHMRARKKCVIIKHANDTRFGPVCAIRTHNGHVYDGARVLYAREFDDPLVARAFEENEVIGIDEVQFFALFDEERARAIAHTIGMWCERGKVVICAGLDTDYRREAFSIVAPLIAQSHEVTKLLAVCTQCGADAIFSARSSAREDCYANPVGGAEKYVALCRACYARAMRENN